MTQQLVIVQRRLTHYRVPFFEALRVALAHVDIELRLLVGEPTAAERSKEDCAQLAWAHSVPCRYGLGGRACWLDVGQALKGAHFVVLAQENGHLHNLPLLLAPQPFAVALWGHGFNWKRGPHGASHHIKRWLTRRADWCFAYTEHSWDAMRRDAPAQRITLLNNAIDTEALRADVLHQRELPRAALRQQMGLHDGPVLLFMASLYAEKGPELALRTAQWVRQKRPDVQLLLAGAGPLAVTMQALSKGETWVHLPGSVQGMQKAQCLAVADVMLNPGVVGLGVLDAFAAELPLVLGEHAHQPPEFAYLQPNINCVLAAPTPQALGQAVEYVLARPGHAAHLRLGARHSAGQYTLAAMVQRFVQGVQQWRESAAGSNKAAS